MTATELANKAMGKIDKSKRPTGKQVYKAVLMAACECPDLVPQNVLTEAAHRIAYAFARVSPKGH